MQLNPTEISDLIKKRISSFEADSEARTEGTIVSVMDGIVRIHGLGDVMSGEMIEFSNGIFGLALNLERDSVGAAHEPPRGRTHAPHRRQAACLGHRHQRLQARRTVARAGDPSGRSRGGASRRGDVGCRCS